MDGLGAAANDCLDDVGPPIETHELLSMELVRLNECPSEIAYVDCLLNGTGSVFMKLWSSSEDGMSSGTKNLFGLDNGEGEGG